MTVISKTDENKSCNAMANMIATTTAKPYHKPSLNAYYPKPQTLGPKPYCSNRRSFRGLVLRVSSLLCCEAMFSQ